MRIKLYQVDAFTDTIFAGNPACICLLNETMPDQWMQDVASEMNLSETAFLIKEEEGNQYQLRWFTPLLEVDLCGHATLAAAHVLWECGYLAQNQTARFNTRSGQLTAKKVEDWIELDFPSEPANEIAAPAELLSALGIKSSRFIGKNRLDYLVVLDSEAQVRAIHPDFRVLKKVKARGVIITAASASPEIDFVSRFFAPASGIDEDPVTGSAHCCLGPYWQRRLGKNHLRAYQASRRGGEIQVHLIENRVILAGQAVTVFSGEWRD